MEFELENGVEFQPNSKFWIVNALKSSQKRSGNRFIDAFLQVVALVKEKKFVEAYQRQLSLDQDLVRDFSFETIRLVLVHLNNLVFIARLTDSEKNMEEATRLIMKAFNYSLNDRAPLHTSRKWASYSILVLLFKAFVRLKTLNLIKNSLRALENAKKLLPALEEHPLSVKVAFYFYTGFYNFSNERYQDAFSEFTYSFENCHKSALKNKLLCLKYLIPTALMNGYVPSARLMRRYAKNSVLIKNYAELVHSIKTGNFKLFQSNISDNEHFYLSQGVFLVLERLKVMCLSRLVKKIFLATDRRTRIPVSLLASALRFSGYVFACEDSDLMTDSSEDEEHALNETECLMAVLIHQGLLKGYLSHERRTLVLSNQDPFPVYAQVVKKNGLNVA